MRKQTPAISTLTAAIALAFAPNVTAQDAPKAMPDDSWISLSGTVTSAEADSFTLDYGDGTITVEMDDWDSYGDAWPLVSGDDVTVYGEVDEHLYTDDTIEAASVYVDDLNSFFYASAADEEELGAWALDPYDEVGDITYVGTVESVNDMTDTFTIDTGAKELTVETDALMYDPLDDEGFQQIEVSDVVSVDGVVDEDFFTNNDLIADRIVTLID
jgi:uncharacterized protein YdeI (BOF family)